MGGSDTAGDSQTFYARSDYDWTRGPHTCADCKTKHEAKELDAFGRCRPCGSKHDNRQAALAARGSRKHERAGLRGWA